MKQKMNTTVTSAPRTAETGTFQACQQVRQFVAVDLHPTEPVQQIQLHIVEMYASAM